MNDNNPPAFPTENERQTGPNSWHYPGMSLWDYFFAQSIGSVIEVCAEAQDVRKHPGMIAGWAAGIADAMMAERAKRHADFTTQFQ